MFRCCVIFMLLLMASISDSSPTHKKHEILTKMGFTKVKAPNTHHRKRLAVESRHHARSDDSHMFVIKLPPNPHYYTHTNPNSIEMHSKNLPVSFKNNGKPAKVYHWNIPVIKKIVSAKHKLRTGDSENEIDFQNEVFDKQEPEREPLKASYYVPNRSKKASLMKYFPGNGKLHSLYVIEKNKKKHYHKLLP